MLIEKETKEKLLGDSGESTNLSLSTREEGKGKGKPYAGGKKKPGTWQFIFKNAKAQGSKKMGNGGKEQKEQKTKNRTIKR